MYPEIVKLCVQVSIMYLKVQKWTQIDTKGSRQKKTAYFKDMS